MIKILLVDDQTMVRQAMASLLDLETDFSVTAQASDAVAALDILKHTEVDIAILDIELGNMSGLELTKIIHKQYPQIKILIVTTFGRPGYLSRAMAAGASGFLVKDAPTEQLVSAIRTVHQGNNYIDKELAAQALSLGGNPLSKREIEVLKLASTGATNAQIAAHIFLAEGTVRNILSEAMAKIGGETRVEAARRAESLGWL